MSKKKVSKMNIAVALLLVFVLLAAVISGCSGDVDVEGIGEASQSESIGESSGEGSGGGEAAEAGHSEAGGEGSEGGLGGEGGGASALILNETYDVTNNGARLILAYDAPSNSFVGSAENTTSGVLTRVRVEIHLSNGTELGPTTPTDLAPGEILPITLPATSQAFDTWSPHAEVGSGEGGSEGSEGGGGGEAGETSGHAEGGEGGSESGLETLMSSPVTQIFQPWSGNLGGIDVIGSYDVNAKAFSSIVTNTLPYKLCYVQTEPHMKMGANTVGELGPDMIGDLNPGETKTSVIYLANETSMAGVNFDGFAMHLEVFACGGPGPDGGAPTINPLTGQPGGGEGGSEGGSEGSENSGGEGSESGGEGSEGGDGEHGEGGEG